LRIDAHHAVNRGEQIGGGEGAFDGVFGLRVGLADDLASLQAAGLRIGPVRPYVGGGPVFVSLSNDFAADIRACGDVLAPECRRLMSWSEVDVGVQLTAGVDLSGSRRVFPFLEYRHLIGQLEIGDFNDGLLTRKPEDLVNLDGTDVSRKYDWSGPNILAGLRIRF